MANIQKKLKKLLRIDADAILKHSFDGYYREGDFDVFATIIPASVIENAPTIEAKPVVHAHWEKYDDSEFCYCSHCGKPAAEDDDVSWHGYCPVCGARMDEFASDNNVGSKTEGVKIPVISMEDVPKIMEEKE